MPTKRRNQFDELRIRELERLFNMEAAKQLGMSVTARGVHGYVDFDDENPGKFIFNILTSSGVERYRGASQFLGSDAQSGTLDDPAEQRCATEADLWEGDEKVSSAILWSRLRDQSASVPERLDALRKLLNSDADPVVSYVVEELAREDLPDEWRNVLVFLAEDLHFPVLLHQRVGARLLVIATHLRLSTKAGADKVVWSAMRRAFSLLSPDPERILPFLERQGCVDTRSVALQCIERVFEPAPPSNHQELGPVADRVKDFAFKFLDPDVFASGENAVIAQNAVCALAALGDLQLGEAVRCVKRLERRWMNRQIRIRFEQLLASWRSRDGAITSHPAFRNLEEQVASLP